MKNLNVSHMSFDEVYKIVKDSIYSCLAEPITLGNVKYHHSTNIETMPSILKHGILTKKGQLEVENRTLTDKERYIFSDDYHANGLDNISVSTMDDDWDLKSAKEDIWSTYSGYSPDIIVDLSDMIVRRHAINYFNEFLVNNNLPVTRFLAINIRILKLYECFNNRSTKEQEKIKIIVEYYNYLSEIAQMLKKINEENNMSIPLRETSFVTCLEEENTKSYTLDLEKVMKLPKLIIK